MMFFLLSGAHLNLTIFAGDNGLVVITVAALYLFFRFAGKWSGAFLGAKITGAEPTVKKFLGFCLVPQAGVAIGLATTAGNILAASKPELGSMIVAVILSSTLVYELFGPIITKTALQKAGEIAPRA
ncbi:MAG: hypothetical protein MJ228_02210 [Bacilli bacterium]|nr:hypothetical protein [Bacilli bacterium]